MCWISYSKPKLKTATKPIKVYKVLETDTRKAPCRYIQYRIDEPMANVVINVKETLSYEGDHIYFEINEGYHSFSKNVVIKRECKKFTIIYSPFYLKQLFSVDNEGYSIFEAYIPSGTKYYKNASGEIVSETLIVSNKTVEICSIKDKIHKIFGKIWN